MALPGTDHIDPSPPTSIAPRVLALRHDCQDDNDHTEQASTEYPRHRLRDSLPRADPKAPQHPPELTVSDQGHDRPMRRKRQIVEPDRRPGAERVARRILPPDQRGEQEARRRDGVADEAEHVDGRVVDRETVGGASVIVKDDLRVEGGRPTQKAIDIPQQVSTGREAGYGTAPTKSSQASYNSIAISPTRTLQLTRYDDRSPGDGVCQEFQIR